MAAASKRQVMILGMQQWIFIFYIPVLFEACLELPGHWAQQFSSYTHVSNMHLLKNLELCKELPPQLRGFQFFSSDSRICNM